MCRQSGGSDDGPTFGTLQDEALNAKVSVYVTTPTLQTFKIYDGGEIEDVDDDCGVPVGHLSERPLPYAHQREFNGTYPAISLVEHSGSVAVRLLHDDDIDEEMAATYLRGGALEPW